MSKKSEFVKYVTELLYYAEKSDFHPMNEEAEAYWTAINRDIDTEKPLFTDNGKLILLYMQDHQQENMWKARDIAEGLFISSRAVSGAMRKLVTDGFVEKVGQDPVVYTLTENGKNIKID